MFTKKPFKIIISCLFVLLLTVILSSVVSGRHKASISTNVFPTKLELNDTSYTLSSAKKTLTLKPIKYNYRAKAKVNNKAITLTGTFDLTNQKSFELELNFLIFNNASIAKSLCATIESDKCPFNSKTIQTRYFEDNQWAVAYIDSPDVGTGLAVLKMNNGVWQVIDGPGTDIETGGYYPASVEEAINNAR